MDTLEALQKYQPRNFEISLLEMEIQNKIGNYQEDEQKATLLSLYILDIFLNTKDLSFLEKHASADFIKVRLEDLRILFQESRVKAKVHNLIHSFLNAQSKSIIKKFKECDTLLQDLFELKEFRQVPKSIGRNTKGFLNKEDVVFLDDMFGDVE